MVRVFVYGTLRQGMYNYEKFYKGHVVHRQMGYVKGSLYTILDKGYPALVPGNRMILGEVMDMDASFSLAQVDEMEGYYGEGNVMNEYDKITCDIYDVDHVTMIDRIPVYMYNLKNPQQKNSLGSLITCNDYVAFLEAKI